MTTQKLNFEQIKDLLPKETNLVYIDYNDNLNEHTDVLQKCVHQGDLYPLYEMEMDWYCDHRYEQVLYYKNELKDDLKSKYDLEENQVEEIMEEFEDEIRDEIENRDVSTPISDLLSNTSNTIMHYDTGYYMESGSWSWTNAEVRLERMQIKKFLQITSSDYDDDLDMMIMQASYGGNLLIFFNPDLEDLISNLDGAKSISFADAHIGIIDHCNGSGDICELGGHDFSFELDKENLFFEKSIKYNWTYSIAGMVTSWCNDTEVTFSKDPATPVEKSPTNALLEQEARFNQVYQDGKCSTGDMDIKRHRNVIYINNYSCGNKCKDCGTFWID